MPLPVIVALFVVGLALYGIARSAPYECPRCHSLMQRPDYCNHCGWCKTRYFRD